MTGQKPTKVYHVTLTPAGRADLERMTRVGTGAAAKLAEARVLPLADEAEGGPAWSDGRVVEALGVSKNAVCRARERFVEEGVAAAITRRPPARAYARKLDGRGEARLVASACSAPPEGRARWTLQLLADRMVVLGHADALPYEAVRQALLKTRSSPGRSRRGACRPSGTRRSWRRWRTCRTCTSGRTTRPSRWCASTRRASSWSSRRGTRSRRPRAAWPGGTPRTSRTGRPRVFMATEPLAGWRRVTATERITRADFAHAIRDSVDGRHEYATKVVLVMDNLDTHGVASRYAAFPPAEAKRIADWLEIHHTPTHGSWLNVAEIELSVLGRQCLDRRIADRPTPAGEVAAWESVRNGSGAGVDWQFRTADARVKLKRLYPVHG